MSRCALQMMNSIPHGKHGSRENQRMLGLSVTHLQFICIHETHLKVEIAQNQPTTSPVTNVKTVTMSAVVSCQYEQGERGLCSAQQR